MQLMEKGINMAYKFCYLLCANHKVAEKLTERIITKKYSSNNLNILKAIWQEFFECYGFIQFYTENDTQKALLFLPPELRCGVILRDILKYDYFDIATILSISQEQAQNLVAQGRKELKNYFSFSTKNKKLKLDRISSYKR